MFIAQLHLVRVRLSTLTLLTFLAVIMCSKSNITFEIIGESLEVGTRPHWDEKTQNLYYVDVPTCDVYRYEPATGKTYKAKVGNEPLGFMFPVEGQENKFVAAIGRKFAIVTWNGTCAQVANVETIAEVDTEEGYRVNRLNGGKVDPYGILWAGTMGPDDGKGGTVPERGSLFSLKSRTVKKHVSKIGISNGLAWNTTTNKMYYIDTLFPGVYQFDYDKANVNITSQKAIFEFKNNNVCGLPDGMAIDTEGKLWVAAIFGSTVVRIDPDTGKLLSKIEFPTPQVTALAFGGKELDILYATTAKIKVDGEAPGHPAGCTYAIKGLGVKGYPGDNFKL